LDQLPYPASSPIDRIAAGKKIELEARLAELIPDDAERLNIATHVKVIDAGAAATAITRAARKLSVDAIVLASHGRSGIGRALLGSTAEGVLRHSEIPVFVVRPAHQR
jgi:nucleotide-binding universal stress UspA family protein